MCVLTPLWWKNIAQHAELHHCMFKNVLQWTNGCRTVKLDRIPASPRWAAGQGHQWVFISLDKGWQFYSYICNMFCLLCFGYIMHSHCDKTGVLQLLVCIWALMCYFSFRVHAVKAIVVTGDEANLYFLAHLHITGLQTILCPFL